MLERYSTERVPEAVRLKRWCAFGSDTLSPLVVRPSDTTLFEATLVRARVGDLGVATMRTTPAQAHGLGTVGGHRAATGGGSLILSLMRGGKMRMRQAGREVDLRPGDVVLWDLRREWEQWVGPDTCMAWFKFPAQLLQHCLGDTSELVGMPLRAGRSETDLLAGVIDNTVRLALSHQPGTDSEAVRDMVCGALRVAYLGRDPVEEDADDRQARSLRRLVDERLNDPGLTVAGLASELGMSLRSFQRCFQLNGVAPRSYILERRLELAAAQLREGGQGPRLRVTSVALACGFNDPAYFSRVFQSRYGVTPRDYARGAFVQMLSPCSGRSD